MWARRVKGLDVAQVSLAALLVGAAQGLSRKMGPDVAQASLAALPDGLLSISKLLALW